MRLLWWLKFEIRWLRYTGMTERKDETEASRKYWGTILTELNDLCLKITWLEFLLWLSGNKANEYPWDAGSISDLTQGVKDPTLSWAEVWVTDTAGYMMLLWLWLWPAAAAPIQPLAWELAYAMGAALKRKKKKSNGSSVYVCRKKDN